MPYIKTLTFSVSGAESCTFQSFLHIVNRKYLFYSSKLAFVIRSE